MNQEIETPKRKEQKVHAPKKGRWRKAFLAAYKLTGILTVAAEKAGVSRSGVQHAMQRDPQFAQEVRDAGEEAADVLEGVALGRATQGKTPSDLLLMFILKARRPEKFRDNYRLEHTGADGAPIMPVTVPTVILLPRDGFEELAKNYGEGPQNPTEPGPTA